jgi:hypothetical protein
MIEKNLLTIAILEGIERSEGCPLCYLWLKYEKRHIEYLLTNEATMNPDIREKVLAAKGFCNHHMHLLYKTAYGGHTEDGLGYALYIQGVVERICEELGFLSDRLCGLKDSKNNNIFSHRRKRKRAFQLLSDAVEHVVQGQQQCPACESLWSSDEIYLHTLVQMLDDKDFRREFKSSKGLCLPHLVSAIRMVGRSKLKNPANVTQTLIEAEIKSLRLVKHYISEFARKYSWDFRNEPPGPEVNANSMALSMLVGVEGLYCRSYKAFSPCESESKCYV